MIDRAAVMREAHKQWRQAKRLELGWSWSHCLKFAWRKLKGKAELLRKEGKNYMHPRDLQILKLVKVGLGSRIIGERIGLSPRTVSERLRDLRLANYVEAHNAGVYTLTPQGREAIAQAKTAT